MVCHPGGSPVVRWEDDPRRVPLLLPSEVSGKVSFNWCLSPGYLLWLHHCICTLTVLRFDQRNPSVRLHFKILQADSSEPHKDKSSLKNDWTQSLSRS